jgi:L-amino acid N-acyltransferase YncA
MLQHPTTEKPIQERLFAHTLDTVAFGLATPDDVEPLVALHAAFFAESKGPELGVIFSAEKTRTWLKAIVASGYCPHIVARAAGRPVGFISFTLEDTYTETVTAFLNTIFVEREHRYSAIPRVLVALAVDMARAENATAFVATASSGMPEIASLKNLFLKAGFAPAGFAVMRGL